MAVYHRFDEGKALVNLAMDEPLLISFLRIRVDRRAVHDVILNQVCLRGDKRWRFIYRHDKNFPISWMSDGYVSVSIEEIVVMMYVIGVDQVSKL